MKEPATLAAQWWADAGLMEHASVAAFARFTMDLLQLGAPPDLLRDTARAMEDEIRHATLCFEIAASLSGIQRGPGPFDTSSDDPGHRDASDILASTIEEGCIEETVAAAVAREIANRTTLDMIREAGEEIAEDESRHADLAWRFVEWLLDRHPELREVAASSFNAALSRSHDVRAELPGDNLERYGKLTSGTIATVRKQVMDDVIGPRAKELLSEPAFA